jgi:hypothetical protein
MKILDGRPEIYARQANAAFLQANLSDTRDSEPIRLLEQAAIDRRHFEILAFKMASISLQSSEKYYEQQLSHDAVNDLLKRKIPKLHERFHWLKQADIIHVTDLLNEVSSFRNQFMQKHGTLPPDGRIYREYRSILETAEPEDERAYLDVVTLEALMNGDIIHGTLPPFSVE